MRISPVFCEFIPEELEDGKLYISKEYQTCIHKCFCGCGLEVTTPLGPNWWTLTINDSITLRPSIGNYQIPCKSHYYITDSQVEFLS